MKLLSKFKYKLIFSLMATLVLTSCKKEVPFNGYTISGTVKGLDQATIKLYEFNFADRGAIPKVIDSTQMTNGIFEFKGIIEHPDQVSVRIGDEFNSAFFLENSIISLAFDTAESNRGELKAIVTGSKLQTMYDAQQAKIDSIMNQQKFVPLQAIRPKMAAAYDSKDDAKIEDFLKWRAQYKDLEDQSINEKRDFMLQYVKEHPTSSVAPWVLGFQFSEGRMSKEEMKKIYPIFKGAAKHTAMFKFYEKTYTDIFERLAVGSKALDFTLKTVDGTDLKLSEVKGKFILVDFWASWCVPCRASFPHLKELLKKYGKDGFVIVGIGTADEEEKWRKAIIEDETPWNHVFDPSGKDERKNAFGKVAITYNIPFLPTTFLLDEQMVIVGRNLSHEELDAKLKALFGY